MNALLTEQAIRSMRVCRNARMFIFSCIIISSVVQIFIDDSFNNIICSIVVALTSLITFGLVLRAKIIRTAPLPAIIVMGFCISTSSGALIAQSFNLKTLIYNLQVPETTFIACAFFQISLLISLFLFVSFSSFIRFSSKINRIAFKPLGLMDAPTPIQLWLMGVLGTVTWAWVSTKLGDNEIQYGDVGGKLLKGMTYLAYAPFLLPVLNIAFPKNKQSKVNGSTKNSWLLPVYFILILSLGLAMNARGAAIMGLANLGMAFLLLMLCGQFRLTLKIRSQLAIVAVLLAVFMPIFSDMSTAMVAIRGQRGQLSNTEMFQRTFEAFQDKEFLEKYREASSSGFEAGGYEENYLDNPFLSRFVQTKFFDNTLALEGVWSGEYSKTILDASLDKIVSLLPTPFIKMLGLTLDKTDLNFSMGDLLYTPTFGGLLGYYRTGSSLGHGISLMGYFVYIAVIPLLLLVFIALQSLTASEKGTVSLSPLILLRLMSVYVLMNGDSLLDLITLLLRDMPQNIFLYGLTYHITRWIGIIAQQGNLSRRKTIF